jgi:hypothetical protein
VPFGQGYGPYAAPVAPQQEDPLAELGLTAAYGFNPAPPMPPMAPGAGGLVAPGSLSVAPAPQPGMPPGAPVMPGMPTPPPAAAGQMGPAQGLAGDPQAQQFLAGKSPEELAQIVMQVREFNQKRAGGQQ